MKKSRNLAAVSFAITAILLLLGGVPVAAQSADASAYPSKPLRLLVGFPPGQSSDNIARIFAERVSKNLGQAVLVENRPGQGGSLAALALKRSPRDGYTMALLATASLVTNPHLYKSIGYETEADLQPVLMLAQGPMYLVASNASGISSLPDLLAAAKRQPGRLNFCSSGVGTLSHLGMEMLMRRAGISLTHVAYQGSTKAMTDLSSGNVDICFDTGTAIQPHLVSKRIRLLAVAALQRNPLYPDTPTLAESGFPGFEVAPYVGIVVPNGTPKAMVERLQAEFSKVGMLAETRALIAVSGSVVSISTTQEFVRQIRADDEKWRNLIKALDLKLE